MLKTQFVQKEHLDNKVTQLREILRQDTKEAAREGAYEGVMDAKIDILQRDDEIVKNLQLDYKQDDTPITTAQFKLLNKRDKILKIILIALLFIFGFIDFTDIIAIFLSPLA